jgi:putative ABC transport system permease protein
VTASALMIGIGLAVFVAVFAAGLKDSFTGGLDRSIKSDLVVRAADQQGGGTLSTNTREQSEKVDGVEVASPIQTSQVRFTGTHGTDAIYGVDPRTIGDVYRFDWQGDGTDAALTQLGTDGALLEKQTAKSHHLEVGDRFSVFTAQRRVGNFVVRGIYKDQVVLNSGFVVSTAAYDRLASDKTPSFVLITTDPGASVQTVKAGVIQALGPVATVQTNQEFKDDLVGQLNQLVAVLSVLLAMSVIISIFGIVNTLVLTIYERTREIGMLRAIGTSRWQIRWTIFHESIITAVIGGILGLIVGLVFGYVITKGLEDQGLSFVVPVGQLILFVIVAVIVGMFAALLPARRAAKLNVLEALHYE